MTDINVLNYKIDSFDEIKKIVKVTFDDGAWAQIRLTTPIPTNIQDLENQIKMYAPTVEHLEARTQEVDLSFITSNIGVDRTCARHQLNVQNSIPDEENYLSSEELLKVQITIAVQRTLAELAGATV
jgi:hypothetical protein